MIIMTIKKSLWRIYSQLAKGKDKPSERLMYRVYLFEELCTLTDRQTFNGKRILEIGPKDGLDSRRLAALEPNELIMIDLPEKKDMVVEWLTSLQCPNKYIEANFMYMHGS